MHQAEATLKRKVSQDESQDVNEPLKRAKHEVTQDSVQPTKPAMKSGSPPPEDFPALVTRQRRSSITQEEKKRGKRLFGGLLTTVSQRSAGPLQTRRFEIEQRQRERAKKQRDTDDRREAKRLARLREEKESEKIWVEESAVSYPHYSMSSTEHQ